MVAQDTFIGPSVDWLRSHLISFSSVERCS